MKHSAGARKHVSCAKLYFYHVHVYMGVLNELEHPETLGVTYQSSSLPSPLYYKCWSHVDEPYLTNISIHDSSNSRAHIYCTLITQYYKQDCQFMALINAQASHCFLLLCCSIC